MYIPLHNLPLYARAIEICDLVLGLEHATTVILREDYEICLPSQTDSSQSLTFNTSSKIDCHRMKIVTEFINADLPSHYNQ
jgi:hypothetical protein